MKNITVEQAEKRKTSVIFALMKSERKKKAPVPRGSLMSGKKIMYIHGFASSALTGTVSRLRETFPLAEVVARDVPVDPLEALSMLRRQCVSERPDLIIGTSMGGMYAEQLHGYDRILVNPAFRIADTMEEHGLMGRVTFQNPREDGQTSFLCNKALQNEYREVSARCFETAEDSRVWGLFGDKDLVVDTYDLFRAHYSNAIHYHGGHRLDDSALRHAVVPVVRWIDDRQEGRERHVLFIDIRCLSQHGDYGREPLASSQKAFRLLTDIYDVFIVAPSLTGDADGQAPAVRWTENYFGVPAWNRLFFMGRRDLLIGDYLLTSRAEETFIGTALLFGQNGMKTWDEVITFFSRLGGQ